VVLSAEEEKAK